MKFYNLKFDCNAPTKQQINIPTNTDYKVGIKVMRNGKQSILSPSEITLGTLSADSDKTNGYVTFTEQAGDAPAMTQKDVVINKGYDYNDTVQSTGFSTSTASLNFPLSCTAESIGVAGLEMSIDSDIQWGSVKKDTPCTADDIATWWNPYTNPTGSFVVWKWPNGNSAAAVGMTGSSSGNTYHFYTWKEDGTLIGDGIPAVIQPNWILQFNNGVKGQANKYYALAYKMKFGEPYTAKFKLNENVYKSQVGDIAGIISDGSTATLSGEYSDGTEFNFNFVTA